MIKINKQTLCTPLKHDNCKECIALCEHAGKDREFCYRGESCKKADDKFKAIKTSTLKEFVNKLKIEYDKT